MSVELNEAYKIIFTQYPDVVGVKEISKMLKLSNRKVYELLKNGDIEVIPCSSTYKVAKIFVLQYLLNRKKSA